MRAGYLYVIMRFIRRYMREGHTYVRFSPYKIMREMNMPDNEKDLIGLWLVLELLRARGMVKLCRIRKRGDGKREYIYKVDSKSRLWEAVRYGEYEEFAKEVLG